MAITIMGGSQLFFNTRPVGTVVTQNPMVVSNNDDIDMTANRGTIF
jgi:hypothetical protein